MSPPSKLIIITFPIPSILSSQYHPIQDLAKEHLILIVNAEIEKTDMVSKIYIYFKSKKIKYSLILCINLDNSDFDSNKKHDLDNYMCYGDSASGDCSDQER